MTAIPLDPPRPTPARRLQPMSHDYSGLDDHTLLARLLGPSDRRQGSVVGALMARFGSIAEAVAAAPGEVVRTVGDADRVLEILGLARELAIRLARVEAASRPVIGSWSSLLAYVRVALAHEAREQFRVLFLDRKNGLLHDEMIALGTVDHAPVYPREVVRRALELSASAMILVHNHPSGDPTPSRADIEMTRKVVEAARVLGVDVHDHLVVGREGTASFKSLGLM